VKKSFRTILESIEEKDYPELPLAAESQEGYIAPAAIPKMVKDLRKQMLAAAKNLEFEKAAELRDRIKKLEEVELKLR
jgi:excinuclease ABC subunit B